ncbi:MULTISPECIES: LysR family transcriptional regulator [unclassified Streptomyces]|uniref:LysR family transcriptional regulator n=1 Tax=unclassified Streptomyces TaxID=2593676 RepID=UPI0027834E77|nr:LysR family transcriptional regulator [Streptomyces sp. DSM 40167]MDQ0404333.1 DNA-binding transcriptional LysR family regulator [Streptomyces sp. DSM 40167]
METRHLVTFQKVATLLSFTRAAKELSYAQSSVTTQIRALETSLGVELFDRLGGRIRLTPAGEKLLEYAGQILALTEAARADVAGEDGPSGTLVVGTMESITSYRMPPLLEFLHHRYPKVQLSLRPSLCAETCHALRQGSFDIGFLMERETRHHGLETVVLAEEPLALVSAPGHPLAQLPEVSLDHLRSTPILATEAGCAYRDLFEEVLWGAETTPFLEFGTVEAIKRGVVSGLGAALLPAMTVAQELEKGEMTTLSWEIPFSVHTQLAWRSGRRLSRELKLFIDQAVRLMREDEQMAASG